MTIGEEITAFLDSLISNPIIMTTTRVVIGIAFVLVITGVIVTAVRIVRTWL